MTRARLVGVGLLGLGMTAALSACGGEMVRPPGPAAAPPTPTATERIGPPAEPELLLVPGDDGSIEQQGTVPARVEVASVAGGSVSIADDALADAAGFDFPPYRGDARRYPRAVITATGTTDDDRFEPGGHDFVWGADFVLDQRSAGPGVDNGDNLVQRGLYGHPAMFKAELDLGRAGCTVTGDLGTLTVRARDLVRPGWHYSLRCKRAGDDLSVDVTETSPDGTTQRSYASHVVGAIGDVDFEDPAIPLAVGGKVGRDGEITADESDQFNGVVVDPYFAILP